MEKKPTVLIVDDEKGLRLGTKRLLERAGYIVSAAENGGEGIALGTASEFDLAIIDLKMPDIDGITVLKRIHQVYPNTICFIATAYASYETAIEAAQIGAFSYIPKPFTPEELISNIKKGYEKRELLVEADKWRREREERLLEVAFEKTRLNTIINSIMDGVVVVNKDGEVVLFNPSALKYLGLSNIVIEEYFLDKLPVEIVEILKNIISADKYEPKSISIQTEMKPNQELFVDVTCSMVPHPDGSLAGVAIVIKDISALKKVEMLKSQFVSMVSHELKAPIAAVHGFLKLINDPTITLTPDQQKDFLERSMLRLDGLLKMVNDLLDISRIETKTVKREIREISVQEVLDGILEIFQLEIDKRNIKLEYSPVTDLPKIKADYDEINRLFTNIISNAIKYNKQDGTLTIKTFVDNLYLCVAISDTGIGMKPEEKERLFREFFRAKNELTKNISGTGLGLSIVKRIVDSYAGKIEVDSTYKEGTTFKILLPI